MAKQMAEREMEQQIAHRQAEMAGAYDHQYDMDMGEMDDEMDQMEGAPEYKPLRYK